MVSQKVAKHVFMSFRRKPVSSKFDDFWMPVEDPDFSGDQVQHDGFRTFYEFIIVIWYLFFGVWNFHDSNK